MLDPNPSMRPTAGQCIMHEVFMSINDLELFHIAIQDAMKQEDDPDVEGKFHDQGDAKWIVIRGQLRGHNETRYGRPAPGRPIGRPGSGCPQGVFGVFLIAINQ
jgi:hypothetical protein